MSTPNFYYENRCIIVTNEDYEWGEHPALDMDDHTFSGCRDFPSSVIKTKKHYTFYKPVLTAGYYADACIDIREVEGAELCRDYIGEPYYFESVREFVDEFKDRAKRYGIPVSEYRLRKLMGKKGDRDLEEFIFDTYKAVDEYLADLELAELNELLDKIRDDHGYQEVVCQGVFSNGEAIYAPVENPLNLRKPVKRPKSA